MNEWKLVVGREAQGKGCGSGWCYTFEIHNGSMYDNTTVKCGANHIPTQNYSACPYNGKPCLFNIMNDPCEYQDVSMDNMDVVNQLYDRLMYFNSTQATPLQLINFPVPQESNPANFGGFWTSWNKSSHQNQNLTNFTASV